LIQSESITLRNPANATAYRILASALAGLPLLDIENVKRTIIETTGHRSKALETLSRLFCEHFGQATRPTRSQIFSWISTHFSFPKAKGRERIVHVRLACDQGFGTRFECLSNIGIPQLHTLDDLYRFLSLNSIDELEWLVAPNRCRGLNLSHYTTHLLRKRTGRFRLVEAPRSRLKFVQRVILKEILNRVPVSDACFGFVKDRSVLQYTLKHCDKGVVIRMDLEDFFPSISAGRVNAMWRTLGYPDTVATYLTWLCTVPANLPKQELLQSIPHASRKPIELQCSKSRLPQGAPTSGSIANLIAYRMDQRFIGFSKKTSGEYSRYADDLAFSWPILSEAHCKRLTAWIAATILDCGFRVNYRKTIIMRRNQRQLLAGIVVNDHPNTSRETTEALRATLFNCVRFGPASQNREMHESAG
jgi:RNA-directed DNA polymerase